MFYNRNPLSRVCSREIFFFYSPGGYILLPISILFSRKLSNKNDAYRRWGIFTDEIKFKQNNDTLNRKFQLISTLNSEIYTETKLCRFFFCYLNKKYYSNSIKLHLTRIKIDVFDTKLTLSHVTYEYK